MSDESNDMSMEDMMELLDKPIMRINSGDIVKGKVISVTDSSVFVNIGYMSDGIIPKEELSDEEDINPKDILKPDDEVYVYIISVNDGDGNVLLSKKKAEALKIWDDLEECVINDKTINVKISEIVKGGAVAYIKGVRAFMPVSMMSLNYVEDLNEFLGKTFEVRVMEIDKDKEKIILSRKEVEKEEKEIKKEQLWDSLKKGEKRQGVVTRLAKFGAFVDLGGVDGLIHISDLSWRRVKDPSEVVSVGDVVEVYIQDLDREKGRISLDLKEVSKNPWLNIMEKYKEGDVIQGIVLRIAEFGAFVEIEPGLEGLVHISEISEERVAKVSSVLNEGDSVRVKILHIDEKEKKLSLSIKEAVDKPVEDFSKYNSNEKAETTLGDLFKDKFKDFKFND